MKTKLLSQVCGALVAMLACGGLLHAETIEQVMARFQIVPLVYVDASIAESMETNANGEVTAWRDMSVNAQDLTSYTTAKGRRVRYAGGRYPDAWVYDMGVTGSGIDLATRTDLSIRSFIAVMDIENTANTFFLGHWTGSSHGGNYYFHRGEQGQYAAS